MSLTKTLSLPSTPLTTIHDHDIDHDHDHVIVDTRRLNKLLNFEVETGAGMLVQNGLIYRQHVLVKSFEIGPDRKLTMAALMNHLQDTSLNHTSSKGIMADGFGGTSYMRRNNLCWVITSTQVVVDRYPCWGEVMEVEHWFYESGKNGLANDWLIRDGNTGEVLVRATNVCVLMNTMTRRLSKFVKQVRDEFAPHLLRVSQSVAPRDERKISRVDLETAHNIRTSIQPGWYDLDINNHVSNIKYIDWII
ncbi:Palmitoyl-acyl carrier protein thioesterase, chloroplastic, partial [Linum grandiflorum]